MRSRSFLNKCHSFIRTPVHHFHPPLKAQGICSTRHARSRPLVLGRTILRSQSTSSTPSLEPDTNSITQTAADPPVEGIESATKSGVLPEDAEKTPPKIRRMRTSAPSANLKDSSTFPRDTNPLEFPEGLNEEIIFVPTESLMEGSLSSLPPPEIYEEALHKLLITLHPHNQARAISPLSSSSRPIEPTLGLYCPIEGGDYIIDSTVHELAFKTGCEVLVLDGVQLAAGEWGKFGKGTRNYKLTTKVQLLPQRPKR